MAVQAEQVATAAEAIEAAKANEGDLALPEHAANEDLKVDALATGVEQLTLADPIDMAAEDQQEHEATAEQHTIEETNADDEQNTSEAK